VKVTRDVAAESEAASATAASAAGTSLLNIMEPPGETVDEV
jgi:hypothetical protein